MKSLKLALLVSVVGFGCVVAAANEPSVVDTRFHTGYIPDGFDTNDNVQVVAEGTFSNTCYKPASVEAVVDSNTKTVELRPKAYHYDGVCLEMLVHYHQVMDLGVMKLGDYKVVNKIGGADLGSLKVKPATSSAADDFLYAPISQTYFRSEDGANTLTVTGEFTNSCAKLLDVVVSVQPKVITVQPISEIQDRTDCRAGKYPFERALDVGPMKAGRYLLHVRSLNAQAINNLVDVQ